MWSVKAPASIMRIFRSKFGFEMHYVVCFLLSSLHRMLH